MKFPLFKVNVFDRNNQNRKQSVEIDNIQYLHKLYSAEVWVNIWCSTEEERTRLIDAVKTRFNELEAHHYSTCSNFNFADKCSKIDDVCEALTSQSGRANKKANVQILTITLLFLKPIIFARVRFVLKV